ncbi:MAG: GntR family transcriptional regulator [Atopobiaceae bacterium]|nr:GntR family transcriptional regulator [Atopobiaceae bacterium]
MLLDIDLASQEPIFKQIRTQIVGAIATGELSPGDALPSVRSLAGDLGVNMHTVNKAYAVLRDEGYVAMRGRSGAVIADTARSKSSAKAQEQRELIASELSRLALEFRAQGGTREEFLALASTEARSVFAYAKEGDSQ